MAGGTVEQQRVVSNIMKGAGALWYAPENEPDPADTVPLFGDPGGVWRHVGFTDEGVQSSFNRDIEEYSPEEMSSAALTTVNTSTLTISMSLVEDIIENMKLAYGSGTITKTAAAVGQIGKEEYRFSEDLDKLKIYLEGKNPQGFFRRLIIPRVVSVATVETANRRSAAVRAYPVELRANCKITDIRVVSKTANAL